MEWAPLNSLFWNTNDSNANLTILLQEAFLRGIDLVIKPCQFITATTIVENLRQNKITFSLILEQISAFVSHPNIVGEVKNLSLDFRQIAWRCFRFLNIFIWIVRSILMLNSKQFHHQNLYSNSLYIVDITFHFLKINQGLPIFPGILVLFWLSVKLLWRFQTMFHIW